MFQGLIRIRIYAIILTLVEIEHSRGKYIKASMQKSEDVETVKTNFLEKEVVPYLQKLEKMFNSGSSFIFGEKPTWADFVVVVFLDEVALMSPESLSPYKTLRALSERVHGLQGIKEYLKKRPMTKF